jgi:hypothetical protein
MAQPVRDELSKTNLLIPHSLQMEATFILAFRDRKNLLHGPLELSEEEENRQTFRWF